MHWLLSIENLIFWLPGIAIFILTLWICDRLTARSRCQRAARDIKNDLDAAYHSGFAWSHVNLTSLAKLDLDFYERSTADLRELGYLPVADLEYLHLTKAFPHTRTGVRVFVSGHGQVYAAAYHIRIRGWKGMLALLVTRTRDIRAVEFESAIDDGRFVISSTTANVPCLSSSAKIMKFAYPSNTPLAALEQDHISNVQQLMVGEDPPAPLVVKELGEIMKLQELQHEIENAHRQERGPLSEEELERLAIGIPRKEREALMAELERLRDEVRTAT